MMVGGRASPKADDAFADFCVARFSRTDLSMIGARALKSAKIADRRYASYL
jgi:hypothetical protein